MDALTQLLRQIGTDRFNDADYQRATLALLNRLDLAQDATVATIRKIAGDVVDAAIAPDGRVFIVERKTDGAWLYEWIHAPLKSRFAGIATAEFISLCGFPDGKTLAYATYDEKVGGRLRFGDWSSDPIPFRVDDGAMFWERDGAIHAVARNWQATAIVGLQFFRLPFAQPVSTLDGVTSNHAVLHGRLVFFARHQDGTASIRTDLNLSDEVSRFTASDAPNLKLLLFPSPDVLPGTVVQNNGMWHVRIGLNWRTPPCGGTPIVSEGRLYFTRQLPLKTPGGSKFWKIEVLSVENKEWTWTRDHVSALRGICYLPASRHTVLLVDPNTKHKGDRLDVVVIDERGKEIRGERVDGATGKMRRVGNVVAVEGRDEHGMTLTIFDGEDSMGPVPLVGRFERLSALKNDKVVGWHYAEGVISVQLYG